MPLEVTFFIAGAVLFSVAMIGEIKGTVIIRKLSLIMRIFAGIVGVIFMVISVSLWWVSRQPVVLLSPTPSTRYAPFFYNEDFNNKRNDGLRLKETSELSFTTKIENGYYDVEVNTGDLNTKNSSESTQFIEIPVKHTSNFDYSVKFSEIQGDVMFATHFRNTQKGQVYFDFFVNGNRKGEYYISFNEKLQHSNKVQVDKIRSLRIRCIKERCDFYLNSGSSPFTTLNNIPTDPGPFIMGFSGKGNIKIEGISIEELFDE